MIKLINTSGFMGFDHVTNPYLYPNIPGTSKNDTLFLKYCVQILTKVQDGFMIPWAWFLSHHEEKHVRKEIDLNDISFQSMDDFCHCIFS